MNTRNLARYYDHLSPRERYPLIVAARSRGDEVEADRLIRSAPTKLFRIANYRGLAEAMLELSLWHVCQLLESAALLEHAAGLLANRGSFDPKRTEWEQKEFRLLMAARLRAYLFLVQTEAWNRFCGELNLDPEAVLRDVPGYTTVKAAAETACILAFTSEEAAEAVRVQWGDSAEVATVETTVAGLRKALAARESWWT
jgi:hypothetical protein